MAVGGVLWALPPKVATSISQEHCKEEKVRPGGPTSFSPLASSTSWYTEQNSGTAGCALAVSTKWGLELRK